MVIQLEMLALNSPMLKYLYSNNYRYNLYTEMFILLCKRFPQTFYIDFTKYCPLPTYTKMAIWHKYIDNFRRGLYFKIPLAPSV
jgi:hypothetical protein